MVPFRTDVAVWIDHREAVIAAIAGEAETTSRVESKAEHSGTSRGDGVVKDERDRRFANHLRTYYDAVIAHLKDANGILVLGPGQVKHELESRIHDDGLGDRLVGVETADKMTDYQVAARARERFQRRPAMRFEAGPDGSRPL